MNGFEFANKALSIKGYALDSIIKLTDGAEVDWLEFKAVIKDQNAKETGKGNEYDLILHLLKALVSMANGSGGMVLLGVDDEGNAVGLKHSGYDGDKDKFTRYISDKVFIRDSWRTQSSGEWRWENNADQIYFDPQWARLQGTDVLVFTVPPREKSLGPLFLINTKFYMCHSRQKLESCTTSLVIKSVLQVMIIYHQIQVPINPIDGVTSLKQL